MVTKRAKQISIFPHQRPESFFLLVLERSHMLVIGMDPIPILVKRKRIHLVPHLLGAGRIFGLVFTMDPIFSYVGPTPPLVKN